MYLKLEVPSRTILLPASNAGAIIAALEHVKSIESMGYGENEKWTECDTPIAISFVPDDYTQPPSAPLAKALKNYESAQASWLGEFQKVQALNAKVKELEMKLETISKSVSGEKGNV